MTVLRVDPPRSGLLLTRHAFDPKRIKLSKLKIIKISHTTFIYHSPIPLLKLINKWYYVVYTTFFR